MIICPNRRYSKNKINYYKLEKHLLRRIHLAHKCVFCKIILHINVVLYHFLDSSVYLTLLSSYSHAVAYIVNFLTPNAFFDVKSHSKQKTFHIRSNSKYETSYSRSHNMNRAFYHTGDKNVLFQLHNIS